MAHAAAGGYARRSKDGAQVRRSTGWHFLPRGVEALSTKRLVGNSVSETYFADDLVSFGSAPAVIWDGGSLSYEALVEAADIFSRRLGTERRLLLLECPNSVEALIAYVGALRGRHPVILTSAGHPADVQRLVDNYRPSARYLAQGDGWQLSLEEKGSALHSDLAVLLSTSGTTGATKLVRLSRVNIDANARSIATYLDLSGSDRAITSLPFHYSYGLSVVNSHLAVGAALALTDHSVIDDKFWRFFEKSGATSLAGVPYTYELLDRIGFCDKRLPTLRSLTQAGGRLPADTASRYAAWSGDRGIRFFVMYGQTEATARMAYMPPEMLACKPGSIGIPIPNGSFSLEGEDGEPIDSPDTTGELVYSGPNVMMGYAEQAPDLAKDAELKVLKTGDLAQYDENGFYRIVGRKNRFSKLFGLRIALDEVESKLRTRGLSGVAAGNDELIAIALTGDADAAAVQRLLSQTYGLPAESFSVSTAPDLPLLPSGKVNYRLILAEAMARKAETPDSASNLDVYSVFVQAMPTRTITQQDSFLSLGGDSLAFISIHSKLDDMAGSLPDGWEELSIADLQALVARTSNVKLKPWDIRPMATDMFLRSIAIIMIVYHHVSDIEAGGGLDVLLLLMGASLMRFQQQRLLSEKSWEIATEAFIRVVIPYYFLITAYGLTFGIGIPVKLDSVTLFDYLLLSNFQLDPPTSLILYWFVPGYFQYTLIVILAAAVPVVNRNLRSKPFITILLGLLLALAVKIACMAEFQHQDLRGHTPDQFMYLPIFGALCYFANTRAKRLFVVLSAIFIGSLSYIPNLWWWGGLIGNLRGGILIASVIILVLFRQVKLPEILRRLLMSIAAASFAIYLSHVMVLIAVRWARNHRFLGHSIAEDIATTALVVGVGWLCAKLIQKLMTKVRALARPDGLSVSSSELSTASY